MLLSSTHADNFQADSSDVSESTYVGGFDWAGQPYVGRYYWSHAHQVWPLLSANTPS